MTVLSVRTVPDPVLFRKAARVTGYDPRLQKFIDDMIETMDAYGGVGLAANQVGVLRRVIVIRMPDEEAQAFINPEIVRCEGERECEEGCLSLPNWRGITRRCTRVRLRALDRHGRPVRLKAEGLLAQALEHEVDHLNGIVYTQRLVSPDKLWKLSDEEVEGHAEQGHAQERI